MARSVPLGWVVIRTEETGKENVVPIHGGSIIMLMDQGLNITSTLER